MQRRAAGCLDVGYLKRGQSSRQRSKRPGPATRSAGTAAVDLDIRTDLQVAGIRRRDFNENRSVGTLVDHLGHRHRFYGARRSDPARARATD
jgi:hypothetical protein